VQSSGPDQPAGARPAEDETVYLDVALALPPFQTFTYRDPRPGARVSLGTQVLVPLGKRHVTGFVVGYACTAPRAVRAIEDVLEEEPALDEDVLALCRWTAAYYLAPLGEVLRAALPQGERAASARKVRLSEEGRLFLLRDAAGQTGFSGLSVDEQDRALLRRLSSGRGLTARALEGTPAAARLRRLIELELVEMGDEVRGRVEGRRELWAHAARTDSEPSFTGGAHARRAFWARLRSAPEGLPLAELTPGERATARTLAHRGWVALRERNDSGPGVGGGPLPVLNVHQEAALRALGEALGRGFSPFVLQGITGSGKTEVYLRLIAAARDQGQSALVLVPEIALTPQLAARFRARFGDDVAVLHSALSPAERRRAWRRLRAREVGIALGARSAVFAPVRQLGVVVVDEEHDGSFKQEEGLRYNGRDLALVRAQKVGAVAVLGSATPSLESFRNVQAGRYRRLLLPARANPAAAARPLPPVEVVDLRREPPLGDELFSKRLLEAVGATLEAGEQVILFLNRRGFSPLVLCRSCGQVIRCSQCAVSMTYHRARGALACHYCARSQAMPPACPGCRRPKLEPVGTGTERVETLVRQYFPAARVARLDRDTAGGGGAALERVLARVQAGEVDILIGTQMVTKGHDFAGVTLVGVLLPDQGMHLPDFRAAERTFQLLEQVAGRAGRGERAGRVIVQTYAPDHPAIACLKTHDYEGFVRGELAQRRAAGYPPYFRMVALRLEGPDVGRVRAAAEEAARLARSGAPSALRVLGPAEAPIPVLRGHARWQVWLAGEDRAALASAARRGSEARLARDVRLAVDVDPQSVL
jgi:primosomal protein N' (replication factor Y) (superfamily II helicase)